MKIFFLLLLSMSLYSKEIIGAIDKFDLPLLNFQNIQSRIDTGATNSSLHCTDIKRVDDVFVKCKLLNNKYLVEKISKIKDVKNSNGIQKRFFIKTQIVIFGKIYITELSLSDRGNMTYAFLLGRDVLEKNFIVDVSKENLSFNLKEKKKN